MRESFPHGHIKYSSSKTPDQPGPPHCMPPAFLGKFLHLVAQSIAHYSSFTRGCLWADLLAELALHPKPIWAVRLHRTTFQFENLHALNFSCKWSSWTCNFHHCEWVSVWANKQKERNQCCGWDVVNIEHAHEQNSYASIFAKHFFKTIRQKGKYDSLNLRKIKHSHTAFICFCLSVSARNWQKHVNNTKVTLRHVAAPFESASFCSQIKTEI